MDRDGLAALSMRTVAAELGVGTMSLYRYVSDRHQLEGLVVDRVVGGVDLKLPAGASWKDRIIILAERVREAVNFHPEMVPLLMTHRHSSRSIMRCAEVFLDALTEAGFSGRGRVIALRMLLSYIVGALQAQHLGPLPGPGTVILSQLPVEEFPLLSETATSARAVSPEEEFRGGVDMVLQGLEASDTR